MPNHKDFWAGLSIRAVPVRFTYGGSREISTMEGQMKYMLLIYNEEKAWGKFTEAQRQGFIGEFMKFTQQIAWPLRAVSGVALHSIQSKGENIMSTATVRGKFTREEADIRALIATVQRAHHNKDAAAIVAPYAPDAVVFNLAPPLAHHGMDLE